MKIKIHILSLLFSIFLFNTNNAQTSGTCNADFTVGIAGLTGTFTSVGVVNTTTYNTWSYGDGTTGTNTPVVTHTYSTGGTYIVKHKVAVYNGGVLVCSDSVSKTIALQTPCNLQAYFNFTRDSLNTHKYYFTNYTSGFAPVDTIRWNFGDGSAFNYNTNPDHTYANAGTYNVCIRVSRPSTVAGAAPCVSEFCRALVVDSILPVSCNANFNFTISGLAVTFTSVNPGTTSTYHTWSFGDGTSGTNIPNIIHTFNTGGTYTVKHKVAVYNNGALVCSDSVSKVVTLQTPCNLQAYFSFVKDTVNRKLVHFTNQTPNFASADTIRWNFGDGSAYSYLTNPNHTYANAGTYNVCIRVSRPNTVVGGTPCVSEFCKVVVIDSILPVSCGANFTFAINGLNVTFTSTNPASTLTYHTWSYGDGTTGTNSPVITHTYATGGTYTVKHKVVVYNGTVIVCADSVTQVITLTAPCNLQAYFSFVKDTVNKKLVHFTNQTPNFTSTDSIRWNFGDGSAYSYLTNPNHTYANAGTYNVCIRVVRHSTATGAYPCVSEYCKVVVIDSIPTCNLQAYFNYAIDSINKKIVHFNNYSLNFLSTDSIRWNFGDGSAFNYANNPTHTYLNAGTYNVCIRVKRNLYPPNTTQCISEYCRIVVIDSVPCNLQAYFSYQRDSVNNKSVHFTNQSINFNSTDSIRWNFGDGSAFNYSTNPTHIYTHNGTYNVCIRVKRNTTAAGISQCVSEYCKTVIVDSIGTNMCNYYVNFNAAIDTANNRTVHFNNTSVSTPNAVSTWSFGDGSTSTTWSPTHTYTNSAFGFQVCLKVQYSSTCYKYVCKPIVLPTTTNCNFQPYPNPASSVVNASISLTQPYIIYTRIFNSNNVIVLQQQQQGFTGLNTVTANVGTLPVGIYRMVVNYSNKECRGTFMKN